MCHPSSHLGIGPIRQLSRQRGPVLGLREEVEERVVSYSAVERRTESFVRDLRISHSVLLGTPLSSAIAHSSQDRFPAAT